MSIPTADPIPRLKTERDLFAWALRLVDYLDKNLRTLALSDQRLVFTNGDNNNINLLGGSIIHIVGPSAPFAITGFGGGSPGRFIFVHNETAQVMTVKNNSVNSEPSNRILTFSGDIPATVALFDYNNTTQLWNLIAAR